LVSPAYGQIALKKEEERLHVWKNKKQKQT